jgi:hypothetical protein
VKLPEVDLKKWGDRVINPGPLPLDTSKLTLDSQPIGIILSPEDIARCYMDRGGPREFNQMLLRHFRQAGAPVEGMAILRLAHGKIFKLRSAPGDFEFRYVWVPMELAAAMGVARDGAESLVQ